MDTAYIEHKWFSPHLVYDHTTNFRRNVGRPRKDGRDQNHENETDLECLLARCCWCWVWRRLCWCRFSFMSVSGRARPSALGLGVGEPVFFWRGGDGDSGPYGQILVWQLRKIRLRFTLTPTIWRPVSVNCFMKEPLQEFFMSRRTSTYVSDGRSENKRGGS